MASGPTQNYDGSEALGWRPRPVLARLVRATAAFGPVLFALAVGAAAARWAPAARTGVPGTVWLLLVVVVSSFVLVLVSRLTRRLVPLSALLRLSLVLPDRVPSRFDVARRTWSPARLQQAGRPDRGEPVDWLLALVGSLAEHDARTRAHGERVQAYAALIGAELGLSREDVDRLSWAALLHDVGKVHVPVEVINKKGRPDDEEWASLQEHPAHGGRLVEPLRGWLGPWLDGVEQHHERFDGAGYPRGLHGADISLAARVIAVADTYDVITSARSYKKPLSAEQARAEITRCAGAQFDPEVVRAFLNVGVGRLRLVAGPATLLAALPGVGSVPAQAVSNVTAVAHTVGGQVLGAVLTAGIGVGVGAGVVTTEAAAADPVPVPVVAAAPFADAGAEPAGATSAPRRSGTPTTSPRDVTTVQALGTDVLTAAESSTTATSERSVRSTTVPPATSTAATSRTSTVTRASSPTSTARPTRSTPTATAPTTTSPTPSTTAGTPVAVTAEPTGTTAPTPTPTATPSSTPTGSTPTGSTPTGSTPTGSTPTGSTPTGSAPTSPTPTSSTPTGSTTGSTPTATPSPTATASPSTTSSCSAAHQGSTRLEDKDLRGCDLRLQTLTGNWRGVKLGGADLTGASLLTLDLSHADLRTADLDLTRLVGVDLTHADLRGTSFRGAVLTGVDLTQAKWDAHTFDGAVLVSVTGM